MGCLRVFCCFTFIYCSYLILTHSVSKSIPSPIKETTTALPKPTYTKLSKPEYQNIELEKLIAEKKDATTLYLSWKRWTAEDMEIVVYYALQESKVSDIEFYVIIGDPGQTSTVVY